jgi:cytochrome c551/c552
MRQFNQTFTKWAFAAGIAILSMAFINRPTNPQSSTLNPPTEDDYYRIIKVPAPEGSVLEVGGIAPLPNGDLAICTRRGDVWIVENPSSSNPNFRKFASGMHELLGIVFKNNNLYCVQRGELTKLVDKNGDGECDSYQTVYAWQLSSHYHEYSYGPKILPDGSFMVTTNVSFGSSDWWAGKSVVPHRGWALKISEDGKVEPIAAGLRSPCGIGMIGNEFFYGDNQGDWMGSGFIMHLEKGDFAGHPNSLEWANTPESPIKMRKDMVYADVNPRDDPKKKPEYIKDESWMSFYQFGKKHPNMGVKPPSVWLPHGVLGVSTSEILEDATQGGFGPFAGQVFVGDQGMSKIARVFLEKVNGQWQGASFDFRSGFRSGTLRMAFANNNEMFVGGTNRGWGSTGKEPYGLERLVWTGRMPFEMKAVRAMSDGFEIEFTQPVDRASAEDLDNYTTTTYVYKYHPVYGSPVVDFQEINLRGAKVSADGMRVRLVLDGLKEGYVHDIKPEGVVSADKKQPLLHPAAYYTLNAIPATPKADFALAPANRVKKKTAELVDKGSEVNTPDNQMKEAMPAANVPKDGKKTDKKTDKKAKNIERREIPNAFGTEGGKTAVVAAVPVITDKEIQPLLQKHTCNACHKKNEKAVGPAFSEIAKRKYSVDRMVKLMREPEPTNWPDFETPMAPMAHLPKKDLEKIAAWINTVK